MIPTHLLPSIVRVLRPTPIMSDGVLTTMWTEVADLGAVRCRIEVGFYRPGKDIPLPIQAGRAPDRPAVYWIPPDVSLQPGDHMECVSGPVIGVWEVRTTPDRAVALSSFHHQEGQCIEIAPSQAGGMY